jgi:3-deoxy-D-manno-octulosonic-acid transferase
MDITALQKSTKRILYLLAFQFPTLRFIYTIFIHLYSVILRFASVFNRKAGLWVSGRKNIFKKISEIICSELGENEQIIWFHCASLGEFEQGRPVIEKIRKYSIQSTKGQKTFKILLTFFSPSGYEIQKNYTGADFIFYLPTDTRSNAKHFVEMLPLRTAFFVKYEFWFNYLIELKDKNVPTYLVSAAFREDQYFFKFYGVWARKQLHCFTYFFLQDAASQTLLNRFGFINTTLSGDTRFDRVFEITQNKKMFPLIKLFAGNCNVIVAGSTWEKDEILVCKLKSENCKLILAPHVVNEKRVLSIIKLLRGRNTVRYSQANEENVSGAEVLIIDNIGMLSSIYQYGQVAFIGGGFGEGIHNVLEASAFGLPAVFGPNYSKFNEAIELIEIGGAFAVNNSVELEHVFTKLFDDAEYLQKAAVASKNYILQKKGATDIVLNNVVL